MSFYIPGYFSVVTTLYGAQAGPVSVILVGVHGNEPCGLKGAKRFLFLKRLASSRIMIEKGTVFLVVGNPRALAQKKRFAEFDLNRAFGPASMYSKKEKKSFEYKRAQDLKLYLNKAGALLDIHSSGTTGSRPFAICEDNGLDIAHHLPVGTVLTGLDAICPGGTDEYMNRNGKIGICIECGYHNSRDAANVAYQAILNFLVERGHDCGIQPESRPQAHFQVRSRYLCNSSFTLSRKWKDFQAVDADDLIGIDGAEPIFANKSGYILFARDRTKRGQEAFYLLDKVVVDKAQRRYGETTRGDISEDDYDDE